MANLLSSATVLAGELEVDTDTVTPGVLGFLTIFAIAIGLYLLMRSLLGKLRGLSDGGAEEESTGHTRTGAESGGGPEGAEETGAAAAEASQADSEGSSVPRAPHT